VPSARGSPTRRRLIALLGGLPAISVTRPAVGVRQPSSRVAASKPITDPIARLFAEFRVMLDRHAVALSGCDRIEAALLAQIGSPRVPLSAGWDGAPRFATNAGTIDDAMPPGRHRRRLQRVLQRRQRRWDEAARGAGLTAAQAREAALDGAVIDLADALLATPARTLDAVVLKLVVLLSTQEPGPSACSLSPWRELRLILVDLRGLAADGGPAP